MGITDWTCRRPTSVMVSFQSALVSWSPKTWCGGGGEHQPRSVGQLGLELAGAPAGMADVEKGLAFVRAGQRLHGIELGGDVDVFGHDEVGDGPLVVHGHQAAADRAAVPHVFGPEALDWLTCSQTCESGVFISRLRISPSAPSSPWTAIKTTVLAKLGSANPVDAISNWP